MDWNVTMLLVHLVALVFAALLAIRAPCWLQQLAMLGFAAASAFLAAAYALALCEVWWWWHLERFGLSIEHLSVLLYLFRIVWQGGLHWNSSSTRSRSSLI